MSITASVVGLVLTNAMSQAVSGIIGNRTDSVFMDIMNDVLKRLNSKNSDLPPNHDLEKASCDSLLQASRFLLDHIVKKINHQQNGSNPNKKPQFFKAKKQKSLWCSEFDKFLGNTNSFDDFNHFLVLDQEQLSQIITAKNESVAAKVFNECYLSFIQDQKFKNDEPDFLKEWILTGWSTNDKNTETSTTIYQAFSLFFQHKVKHDPEVGKIFEATIVAVNNDKLNKIDITSQKIMEYLANEMESLKDNLCHAAIRLVPPSVDLEIVLNRYLEHVVKSNKDVRTPLMNTQEGNYSSAEKSRPIHIDAIRIDLPLQMTYDYISGTSINDSRSDPSINFMGKNRNTTIIETQEYSGNHTATSLDEKDFSRLQKYSGCRLSELMEGVPRLIVAGDPGSGKSLLLSSLAFRYANRNLPHEIRAGYSLPQEQWISKDDLPKHDWIPVIIPCRDLNQSNEMPHLDEIITTQLRITNLFSDEEINQLKSELIKRLYSGKGLLLVDGLDEITDVDYQARINELISTLSKQYGDLPIVVTSRINAMRVAHGALSESFDQLMIAPLDKKSKESFVSAWENMCGNQFPDLKDKVCNSPAVSKLSENIFILSMLAHLHLSDGELSDHRRDVYRRYIKLMISRQRQTEGQKLLEINDVWADLAYLGYEMWVDGSQRWYESRVLEAIQKRRDNNEVSVTDSQRLEPAVWLNQVIECLGIINVVGFETDSSYNEQRIIQMFHLSFMEYFAAHALLYKRTLHSEESVTGKLSTAIKNISFDEKIINTVNKGKQTEPVVSDTLQELVSHVIEELDSEETSTTPSISADEILLMILSHQDSNPLETRARAVFAMQCLVWTEKIRPETVNAVFDFAADNLHEWDGFGEKRITSMDHAAYAVINSPWRDKFQCRFIQAYIESRDSKRNRIGSLFLNSCRISETLNKNTVADVIAPHLELMKSNDINERVNAALNLVEVFFQACVLNFNFLAEELIDSIIATLMAAISLDEATSTPAIWALSWLVDARNSVVDNERYRITIEQQKILQTLVVKTNCDSHARSNIAYLLSVDTSIQSDESIQIDWMMEWARVADGDSPHRSLTSMADPSLTINIKVLCLALSRSKNNKFRRGICISLGRLRCFIPEMIDPLFDLLEDDSRRNQERNEALIYLSFIDHSEVTKRLASHARAYQSGEHAYSLADMSLLGLVKIAEIETIRQIIGNDEELIGYDAAYTFVLAGMEDPQGRQLLSDLQNHPNEKVRADVVTALKKADHWNKHLKN